MRFDRLFKFSRFQLRQKKQPLFSTDIIIRNAHLAKCDKARATLEKTEKQVN